MDESSLRAMFVDIADAPEPAPRIDIDRARRRGLRNLWTRRAGVSVAALAVVAGVVTVPRALTSAAPERTGLSPAASGTSAPKATSKPSPGNQTTPRSSHFNPLVPYATFGWLPGGFTEGITPSSVHDGLVSTTDSLTLTATSVTGESFLQLTVLPKGNCTGLPIGNDLQPAMSDGQAGCSVTRSQMSGKAPDMNGRPAYWAQGASNLIWEYAPDSWAMLSAQGNGGAAFPAALAQKMLPQIASTVRYGQRQPILFPFQYSGMPAGWSPVSVSYTDFKGEYLATGVMAGPSAQWEQNGLAAMSIDATGAPGASGEACFSQRKSGGGAISPATSNGVAWVVVKGGGTSSPLSGASFPSLSTKPTISATPPSSAAGSPSATPPSSAAGSPSATPQSSAAGRSSAEGRSANAQDQQACSLKPVDGSYYSLFIRMDFPGAAQTGGAKGILARLRILGLGPAISTRSPFAG